MCVEKETREKIRHRKREREREQREIINQNICGRMLVGSVRKNEKERNLMKPFFSY